MARRITEQVNPRTADLDQLGPRELIAALLEEDASVPAAVQAATDSIVRASDALVATLKAGGRWFNLGAGTSGRLGLLDAAEIPPTFGLAPERVRGIVAGGEAALAHAVEGAEDDADAALRDLEAHGFGERDALLALSASGTTRYVLAAAEHARALGATTVAVTCAPDSPLVEAVEIPIVVVVGPEAIAGSTRLKGGLAQKMVLHALSTAVMVRLGRVRGNRMTGLTPLNEKLRERARLIVTELSGCTPDEARSALESSGGSIEQALEKLAGEGGS
jgi:N-acetylmuramic acid 6-phosphate etherase